VKVYSSIDEFQNVERPIVTTGTFDGVHFGHRKIIDRLKQVAQNCDGETVLLTFSPHPRMVLFPDDQDLKLLNTIDEYKDQADEIALNIATAFRGAMFEYALNIGDQVLFNRYTEEYFLKTSEKLVDNILRQY